MATEIARFEAIKRSSSHVGSGTTIRPTTAITSAARAASAAPTRGLLRFRLKVDALAKARTVLSARSRENADHAAVELHRGTAGTGRDFEGGMQAGEGQVREALAQDANVDVRRTVE